MSPGQVQPLADLGDHPREDGVAQQTVCFVVFTGIHVGFAGIAGGIDEKIGGMLPKPGFKHGGVCVINLCTA